MMTYEMYQQIVELICEVDDDGEFVYSIEEISEMTGAAFEEIQQIAREELD